MFVASLSICQQGLSLINCILHPNGLVQLYLGLAWAGCRAGDGWVDSLPRLTWAHLMLKLISQSNSISLLCVYILHAL